MACGGCNDVMSQKRFTLEKPAVTGAGPSGHVDLSVAANWTKVSDQLWGTFVTVTGSESQGAQITQGQRQHTIEFPWNSVLMAATSKYRLRIGTRVFNITSLVDVHERGQVIQVTAIEPIE